MNRVDLRVNAILDASLRDRGELARLAALAAANGATMIQYRDKHASTREMIAQAHAIRAALAGADVPLLVNDRVDIALAAGLDGVHLGRDDMDAATARRLLGAEAIIGLTVKNEADAHIAVSAAVDYACIGGVFETLSKHNPDPPVGLDGFATLRQSLGKRRPDLPVGAIAGIDDRRAFQLVASGASGVAALSAIFRAPDMAAATRKLRRAVDRALGAEAQ